MNIIKKISVILTSLLVSMAAAKAETLNMDLAYGASNFHSANATEFANAVTEKTGGKLTIKTHPGGSLFKGGAILRAVQQDKHKSVKDLCLLMEVLIHY